MKKYNLVYFFLIISLLILPNNVWAECIDSRNGDACSASTPTANKIEIKDDTLSWWPNTGNEKYASLIRVSIYDKNGNILTKDAKRMVGDFSTQDMKIGAYIPYQSIQRTKLDYLKGIKALPTSLSNWVNTTFSVTGIQGLKKWITSDPNSFSTQWIDETTGKLTIPMQQILSHLGYTCVNNNKFTSKEYFSGCPYTKDEIREHYIMIELVTVVTMRDKNGNANLYYGTGAELASLVGNLTALPQSQGGAGYYPGTGNYPYPVDDKNILIPYNTYNILVVFARYMPNAATISGNMESYGTKGYFNLILSPSDYAKKGNNYNCTYTTGSPWANDTGYNIAVDNKGKNGYSHVNCLIEGGMGMNLLWIKEYVDDTSECPIDNASLYYPNSECCTEIEKVATNGSLINANTYKKYIDMFELDRPFLTNVYNEANKTSHTVGGLDHLKTATILNQAWSKTYKSKCLTPTENKCDLTKGDLFYYNANTKIMSHCCYSLLKDYESMNRGEIDSQSLATLNNFYKININTIKQFYPSYNTGNGGINITNTKNVIINAWNEYINHCYPGSELVCEITDSTEFISNSRCCNELKNAYNYAKNKYQFDSTKNNEYIIKFNFTEQGIKISSSSNQTVRQAIIKYWEKEYKSTCEGGGEEKKECKDIYNIYAEDGLGYEINNFNLSCTENTKGYYKDIGDDWNEEEWECIFDSEPYVGDYYEYDKSFNDSNRYCDIYCREEVYYSFPSNDFTVYAGGRFTVNTTLEPSLSPVSLTIKSQCQTHGLEENYKSFAEDYENANDKLPALWDDYQIKKIKLSLFNNKTNSGSTCERTRRYGATKKTVEIKKCKYKNPDPDGNYRDAQDDAMCELGLNAVHWVVVGTETVYSCNQDSHKLNEATGFCTYIETGTLYDLKTGSYDGKVIDIGSTYCSADSAPITSSTVNSARTSYNNAKSARDTILSEIKKCNYFIKTNSEFNPEITLKIDDLKQYDTEYKLNSSKSYKSIKTQSAIYISEASSKITATKNWNTGSIITSSPTTTGDDVLVGNTDKIDSYECKDGTPCKLKTDSVEYPTDNLIRQETILEIEYYLPFNTYRYVTKNGVSYTDTAIRDPENDIDVGYDNIPIAYNTPLGTYNYTLNLTNGFGNNHKFTDYITSSSSFPIKLYNFSAVTGEPIKFECSYQVTSGFHEKENLGIDIIYRPISLEDPFPHYDASGRNAGSNWQGYEYKILNNRDVDGSEVYTLKPMFEFVLTSGNIAKIRNYNDVNSYDDFNLVCTDGKYCKSDFLNEGEVLGYFSYTAKNPSGGECMGATKDNWENCRQSVEEIIKPTPTPPGAEIPPVDEPNEPVDEKTVFELTINYVYKDGTMAFPSYTKKLVYNATYNIDSPAKTYYKVDNPKVTGTITKSRTINVTYTPINDINNNFVADEEETKYTITYVANGASNVPAKETGVLHNTEKTVSTTRPSKSGYIFTGWTTSNVTVSNGKFKMPNSNVTFTAQFASDSNNNGIADSNESFTLTIKYIYSNGNTADGTYSGIYKYNQYYSIQSTNIPNYKASSSIVSGYMPLYNQTITVTYTPINDRDNDGKADEEETFILTINYNYSNDTTADGTYSGIYKYNEYYSIQSTNIPNYRPSISTVSGYMPYGNHTVNVTYTPINDSNGNGIADEEETVTPPPSSGGGGGVIDDVVDLVCKFLPWFPGC